MHRTTLKLRRLLTLTFLFLLALGIWTSVNAAERVKLIDDWKFRRGDGDDLLAFHLAQPRTLRACDAISCSRPASAPNRLRHARVQYDSHL